MQPLQPRELLGLWERGRFQNPVQRALTLLESTRPDACRESLAELALGRRDYELLSLRQKTFGDWIRGEADCAECQARVEFDVAVSELISGMEFGPPADTQIEMGSYQIAFRTLTSLDLIAISGFTDVDKARLELVNRCVLEASLDGETTADELPEEVVAALAKNLELCDPSSEILLHLRCPDCRAEWDEAFDIASFLWAEIVASAEDLLSDVDLLARAYGWPEGEVLALTPARRAWYVEAVS